MKLGWIDFSKGDREKAMEVMNLLQTPGAVDEIGIGQIRDAFSNRFFPGTSTIQTRAKYFFLVPYTLYEAINGEYGNDINKVIRTIDDKEHECGKILKNNEPLEEGIIGKRVLPERWVSRAPSEIYWTGLKTFKILEQQSLSLSEMIRLSIALNNNVSDQDIIMRKSEKIEDWDDEDAGRERAFHFINLPDSYSKEWRENLSINLTFDEAVFLREKIEKNTPNSLFEYILINNVDVSKYDDVDKNDCFHVLFEDLKDSLPETLKNEMQLACDFSGLVYAISARYNCKIAEGRNERIFSVWNDIYANIDNYISVDLDSIFRLFIHTSSDLRRFLVDIKAAFLSRDLIKVDDLILSREIKLKTKARSKLSHIEDQKADKWVGSRKLDYRFDIARKIIKDIYRGEGRSNV